MSKRSSDDKNLLDRLKALNPTTTVSLSGRNTSSTLSGSRSGPPHNEGAGTGLTDRLKQLREKAESASGDAPKGSGLTTHSDPGALPPLHNHTSIPPARTLKTQKVEASQPTDSATAPYHPAGRADFDELLQTDDGFLEDLLGEEVGLEDSLPLDARAELDRLHELAAEFSRLTAAAGAQKGQTVDEDDDSNGEDMTREINDIVSQAVEAASSPKNADAASAATVGGDASVLPSSTAAVADVADVADVENEEGPDLALPSVPTDAPSPTVPQSAGSPAAMTGNFEDDMARRMAALRSFRPSLGAQDQEEEDSNPLGLPSVPTFKPSEGNKPKPGPAGRAGFTDEDMQTWCVACLEDGTLICPECGDEVYCSQCWFDMHKGPAAGFEERSHRAQQFNKDQRKKRVALGA